MRLSLKLAAAMALITAIVLVVSDWLALRREVVLIEADRGREVQEVAEGLARLCELTTVGEPSLVLQQLDQHVGGTSIRWNDAPETHAEHAIPQLARDADGAEVIRASALVRRDDRPTGAVEVSASMLPRDEFIERFLAKNAVAVVLVTLFCGLVALVAGHRLVGARVEELVDKAHRVGQGDFTGPLQQRGRDELTLLYRALNDMTEQLALAKREAAMAAEARVQAEIQLRHADRLTTVGQLAAGVAHELGTPLNVISGRAALLRRRSTSEVDKRDAATIREQAARITGIVQRMLDFARKSEPELRVVDLGEVALDAVDLLDTTARKEGVELELELTPGDLTGALDPAHIRQVITNLVINAVQAGPKRVVVRVSRARCDGEDHLHVEVSDDGPGIPQEHIDRVFDPFFTTKEPGEGTGLGLAVVHGIMADHAGSVSVDSAPGEGATFTVHLPHGEVPR